MKLATRLAIPMRISDPGILLAAVIFSWQTARISDLFAQRFEARGEQIAALGVDRDLQDLMSTFERLLYVKDPVRRAKLTAELDELDKSVDGGLRRRPRLNRTIPSGRNMSPRWKPGSLFQASTQSGIGRIRANRRRCPGAVRDLDGEVTLLGDQIDRSSGNQPIVQQTDKRAREAISTSETIIWTFTVASSLFWASPVLHQPQYLSNGHQRRTGE